MLRTGCKFSTVRYINYVGNDFWFTMSRDFLLCPPSKLLRPLEVATINANREEQDDEGAQPHPDSLHKKYERCFERILDDCGK